MREFSSYGIGGGSTALCPPSDKKIIIFEEFLELLSSISMASLMPML